MFQRVWVMLLVLALALGAAVAAHARWTSPGSGQASAQAPQFSTVTVLALTGQEVVEQTLVPGGTGDVVLLVDNPNDYAVDVYSIVQDGTIVPDPGHSGCNPTGVTFNAPPIPPDPVITLDPGQTLLHLPGTAVMDSTSASACQGATFEIPIALTVRR